MEKNRIRSLVLALILGLTAVTGAVATPAETLPSAEAVLENAGGGSCTAAAADTPEAQMRALFPQPVPSYCVDCKPCTSKAQCGITPEGLYAGECWLAPSYCPFSSGPVCVCR